MNIAGIDNGVTGAIAIMDSADLHIVDLIDMPIIHVGKRSEIDERRICDLLVEWEVRHAYIERAQSMPGQGIASTAGYMCNYGIIRGICAGLEIPYTLITPQAWKKSQMAGMGKEKGASIVRVGQLYPELKMSRVKDHGKCDAILMARHGVQNRL